jgi:hypothetical protein
VVVNCVDVRVKKIVCFKKVIKLYMIPRYKI